VLQPRADQLGERVVGLVQQRRELPDTRPEVEDERVAGHVVDLALDGHRLAREASASSSRPWYQW